MKNIWEDEEEIKDLRSSSSKALTLEIRQLLEALLKAQPKKQTKKQSKNRYKCKEDTFIHYLNLK